MVYKVSIKRKGKSFGPYYYKSIRLPNGKVKSIYVGKAEPRKNIPVFLLLFCAIIVSFLFAYQFSGFVIQSFEESAVINLEETLTSSKTLPIDIAKSISSAKLSGTVSGYGIASVYIIDGLNNRFKVYEFPEPGMSVSPDSPVYTALSETCLNTCNFGPISPPFKLLAEIDGNLTLHINNLKIGTVVEKWVEEKTVSLEPAQTPPPAAQPIQQLPDLISSVSFSAISSATPAEVPVSPARPARTNPIPDITIYKNNFSTLNLSNYFENAESYSAFSPENITIEIQNGIATIRPEENFTGTSTGRFTAIGGGESAESNEFNIVVSSGAISFSTAQGRARLGSPVKWVKKIQLETPPENLTVQLPKEAMNITIFKIDNEERAEISYTQQLNATENETSTNQLNETSNTQPINETQNITTSLNESTNITQPFNETATNTTLQQNETEIIPNEPSVATINTVLIEGNIILETKQKGIFQAILDMLRSFTGMIVAEPPAGQEDIQVQEVSIQGTATEYEIEYETPAPYAEETEHANSKTITVIGPDEFHYTDIVAFTELPKEVNENAIHLYWLTNSTKVEINTTKFDLNSNGRIDYIEWTVPSLSNQTYELNITILNVHSEPSLYGNWTVYFNTTGTSDLNITATFDLNYSSETTRWHNESEDANLYDLKFLEVKCGNEILNYEWQGENCAQQECSVYIPNYSCNQTATEVSKVLTAKRHVLKFSFGGQTEYAYNDVTFPLISFVTPTPADSVQTTNTSVLINVSVTEANLSEFKYGWDNTNYTFYNSSLVLMYNFDNLSAIGENDTLIVDVSGGNNNGSVTGSAVYTPSGKYNGAYGFDGNGAFITPTSATILNAGSATVEAWIYLKKYAATSQTPIIVDRTASQSDFQFIVLPDDNSPHKLVFSIWNSSDGASGQSTQDISLNTWTHVAGVYNGTNVIAYINGMQDGSTGALTGNVNSASNTLRIGGDAFNNYFNGTIDEFRIWNRGLTADEINHSYWSNLNKYDSDDWVFYTNQSTPTNSTYTYSAYANDSSGNANRTERLITIGTDTIYPIFSSYWDNNGSLSGNGTALFNVTLANTNGTVWLSINGTNYTAQNITTNMYNVSLFMLNGTYSYNWSAYGNGTGRNFNISETRSYTVNTSESTGDSTQPYFTSIPANTTIKYNNQSISADFDATDETAFGSFYLGNWTDIFSINPSTGVLSNTTVLPVGQYIINVSINDTAGNQNQTWFNATVIQADNPVYFSLTPSGSITYPTQSGAECSVTAGTASLKRDGSVVSNPENATLGAASYTYNCSTSGNQNYTENSTTFGLTVSQNATPLSITGTTPIIYPTLSDFAGSGCPAELSCTLNISNAIYGAGTHTFNYSTTGNANYSANSTTKDLVVSQNTTWWLSLTLSPSASVTYPAETTATGANCPAELTCNLYRNTTGSVSNPETATLGTGTYNYTYNTTGNTNYSAKDNSTVLIVLTNTSSCDMLFNETSPVIYPQAFTAYTNCSSSFQIYRNGTAISNNSVQDLAAGHYNFTVIRNDTGNYTNYRDEQTFIINKATTALSLASSAGWNINYPTATTITGSSCPTASNCTLYRDGADVAAENGTSITIGAGSYGYVYNTSGNENYTADSESNTLAISQANITTNLYINNNPNQNASITYGTQSNATCYASAGTANLFRNESAISNPDISTYGVNSYAYRCNATGNQNYTNNNTGLTYSLTINQASQPLNLSINKTSWTITYNETTNVSGTGCLSNCTLYQNGTDITNPDIALYGAGTYNFTYNSSGNQNYTENSTSNILIVSQAANALTLASSAGWSYVYGTETTLSCTTTSQTPNIYQNSTSITNPFTATYGAGTYNISCNISSSQNYTANESSQTLVASQATGLVYTYLNNNRANATITNSTSIWLNASLAVGTGNLKLYNNGTLINSGAANISNLTSFSTTGLYNITGIYEGNQNYTSDDETWWVNSTETPDTAPPQLTITSPANTTYNTASRNFNVSANEALNTCVLSLNSFATNYTMVLNSTSTGAGYTNSSMNDGAWTAVFACNDTAGNWNSTEQVAFTVDTTPPTITIVSPTNTTYSNSTITINITNDTTANTVWWHNGTDNQTYTGVVTQVFADGVKTITAYANDSVGNLNHTNVTFTVDTIPPNITINSPTNQTYTNSTITINLTASTDNNTVWWHNGTDNQTYTGIVTQVFSEGVKTIIAYANDSANNLNQTSITFTVDTTPPTITINSPTPQVYSNSTILINFTATDNIAINTLWYYNGTANRTFTTAETITLPNGTYTFIFYANDTAGNLAQNSMEFIVDTDTQNWVQFGKTNYNNRYYPGTVNMVNFSLLWNYTTENFVVSSPAVSNGIVYIGSHDNKTYALNATNGSLIWNYTTGNIVGSSPAVSNGIVYIGSDDNQIYALNASNGSKIWNYTTGSFVYSSPAVSNGIVYIGSDDNQIYALNASNGSKIWNYTTGNDVSSSPAVSNGIVYIGSYDENLYALNASTGSYIWNYTTGESIIRSPAVSNGIVYIGSDKVYALNTTTGSYIWNYTTGYLFSSSPAVSNGVVFFGSYDSQIYALNASNGSKIWNYTTGGYVISSPAISNGIVYIGSLDNKIYALNATTGSKIWNYTTGNFVYSSPAVSNGIVYIGSSNRNLYAFASKGDTTPPNITIVSPTNTTYSNSTITINLTASTDNNTVWWHNGTDNQTYTGVVTQVFSNGVKTITAYANDSANNLNQTSVTFTVDTTPPLISFISPTPPDLISTSNTSILINTSITEQNLSNIKFNWNGTNYTFYNSSLVLMYNFDNLSALGESSTKVVDLSASGNNGTPQGAVWTSSGKYSGAYSFDGNAAYISASSTILNNAGSATITAWIKLAEYAATSQSPIVVDSGLAQSDFQFIVLPNDNNPPHKLRFSVWNSSDGASGQSTQDISLNTWTHVAGIYNGTNIMVYINGVQDGSIGSLSGGVNSVSDDLGIGGVAPDNPRFNGSIDELRIWNRGLTAGEIYQSYVSNLQKFNSTQWYFYANQSNLTNGTYTYFSSAEDDNGNENRTETRTVTIDTVPPNITIVSPTNQTYTNSTITINITNDTTANTVWWHNGTDNQTYTGVVTQVFSEGVKTITAYANDSANNLNQTSITFTVDTTMPGLTILLPANTTYNTSSRNFNVSANENISSCILSLSNFSANYTMVVNSSGNGAGYTNSSMNDGAWTAKFACNDTAGNWNSTEQVAFTVDTTPPNITINSPTNTTYSNSTITINITNDTTANTVWWNNGTNNITYTGVVTQNFSNGVKTITAYANDSANNLNQTSITFTIDTIPPNITIASPTNITYTNATITINLTASTDNNTVWWGNSTNNYTYTGVTTSVFSQGAKTITAYANDSANNLNQTSITFTIDTIPPNITIVSPTNTTYSNSTITINITNSSDTNTVWWNNGTNNITYTSVTTQVFTNGVKTITAYANDSANNLNQTSVTFTIDTTPPSISFISPTPPDLTSTSNTSIRINTSITEQNLSKIKFNWNGANYTFYNSSLVLMYNFDNLSAIGESSTKVVDLSAGGNNGTPNGNAVYTSSGKYGGAYSFDGAGDYIGLANNEDFNFSSNNFSIEAWFNFNNKSGIQNIIAWATDNGSDQFYWNGSGFHLWGEASDVFPSEYNFGTINTGEWHYIVWNRMNNNWSIYIDGIPRISVIDTRTLSYPNHINGIMVGAEVTAPSQFWNGSIDEVRIWNRGLTAGEIYQNYVSNLRKFNSTQWYFYANQSNLTNGTYTYFSSAEDNNGNENRTETRTVTIDTTPPNITIASPTNITYTNATITINLTASTDNNTVWWNNGTNNQTYVNVTTQVFSEGNHTIIAYANDSAGNLNNTNITFTVDTTQPRVTIVLPANTTYTTTTINFNFTMNEAGSCRYTLNNGLNNSTMTANSSNTGFNATNSTMAQGMHTVAAYCNDTAGNINYTQSAAFTIDATGPSISGTASAPSLGREYQIVNITYNVTENIALNDTYITVIFPDSTESNYTYSGSAIDLVSGTTMAGLFRLQFPFTILNGTYRAYIYARDAAQNITNSTATFEIDPYPPTVSSNTSSAIVSVNSNFTILANATDDRNISAVWAQVINPYQQKENRTMSWNGSTYVTAVNATSVGSYVFYVYANDTANNAANTTGITVTSTGADTSGPIFDRVLIEPNMTVSATIRISTRVVDPDSVSSVISEITNPLNAKTNYTASSAGVDQQQTTGINETTMPFSEKAAQLFTATSTMQLAYVSFYINKTGDPGILYAEIAENNNGEPGTVLATGTQTSSAVNETASWVDIPFTDPPWVYTNRVYWLIIYSSGAEGNYIVTYNDSNPYRNGSMKMYRLFREINETTGDVLNSSYQWVDAENSDMRFRTYGGNNWYTISYTAGEEGNYTLKGYANDSLGYWANGTPYTFTVDNTNPWINWTNVSVPSAAGGYFNISANVSDANLDSVFANVTDPFGAVSMLAMSIVSGTRYNTTFNATNVGNYTIYIFANDSAGNINSTNAGTYTVNGTDTSAPYIFNATVRPQTARTTVPFNITVNTTDNIGISSVIAEIMNPAGAKTNYSMSYLSGNTYNLTYTASTEGVYNATIYVNDTSNNTNRISSTFKADNTSPILQIPWVCYTDLCKKTDQCGYTIASEGVQNLSRVWLEVASPDGRKTNYTAYNPSWDNSYKYFTASYNPNMVGTYNLTYYANDTAGNIGVSSTINNTILRACMTRAGYPIGGYRYYPMRGERVEFVATDYQPGQKVNVSYINSAGSVMNLSEITANSAGTYYGYYTIPANASFGRWTISLVNNSETQNLTFYVDMLYVANFTVSVEGNSLRFSGRVMNNTQGRSVYYHPLVIDRDQNGTGNSKIFSSAYYLPSSNRSFIMYSAWINSSIWHPDSTVKLSWAFKNTASQNKNGSFYISHFYPSSTYDSYNAIAYVGISKNQELAPGEILTLQTTARIPALRQISAISRTRYVPFLNDADIISYYNGYLKLQQKSFANYGFILPQELGGRLLYSSLQNSTFNSYQTNSSGHFNITIANASQWENKTFVLLTMSAYGIAQEYPAFFELVPPVVSLVSPAAGITHTSSAATFTYNVSDFSNMTNCSLYLNGALNQTNTTPITNNITQSFLAVLPNGNYNWSVSCYDRHNNLGVSANRTLAVSVTSVSINFTSPTPANRTSAGLVYVNVSSTNNMDHMVFVDWNNSLIAWYRFNGEAGENSTDIADWSSWRNNLSCSGTACPAWNASGRYAGAFTFDGSNDRFKNKTAITNNIGNLSAGFTFSAWINPANVSGATTYRAIVYKGETSKEANIMLYGDEIYSDVDGGGYVRTTNQDIPVGRWTHVAVTWDNDKLRVYRNGTLAGTSASTTFPSGGAGSLFIGSYRGTQYYFNGTIDDVMVFNRTLTASEILSLYNATANQYYSQISGLQDGINYTYQGVTEDATGNVNVTEIRQVTINTSNTTTCGDLATANSVYKLAQNISSTDSCFSINATNITLDCQNHLINYSQSTTGYGIYSTANLSVVKNCSIKQGNSTSNSYAIYFNQPSGTQFRGIDSIINNTISTIGSASHCLYIGGGNNYTIANNTMNCVGATTDGINFVARSDNLTIKENKINVTQYGIYNVLTASSGVNVLDNYINSTTANSYGIYARTGTNWNIERGVFKGLSIGILFSGATNSIIRDNNITSAPSGSSKGITIQSDGHQITGNYINMTDTGSNAYGILLSGSTQSHNNFENNTIFFRQTANSYGIGFGVSTNNTFKNTNIYVNGSSIATAVSITANSNATFIGGIANSTSGIDILIVGGIKSGLWNFTNVSHIDRTYTAGSNGTLLVGWYATLNVTNTSGSPVVANVTVNNTRQQQIISTYSGANGYTSQYLVYEVNQTNSTGNATQNPHTITATNASYSNYTNSSANISYSGFYSVVLLTAEEAAPPRITIVSPANRTYNSAINFNISSNEPLGSCKYTLNSWAANTTMSSFNSTYYYNTTTVSSDGTYTARFWCNDIYGVVNNTESVAFTVDTTPPTINIINPQPRTYLNNITQFNVSTNENTSWCGYKLNSGSNTTMTRFNDTYFHNTTILSDGMYTATFHCNDTTGNLRSNTTIFAIDVVPPSINLEYPLTHTYVNRNQDIDFNYTPYGASLDTCQLYGNWTGSWVANKTNSTPSNNTGSIFRVNITDGIYKWNVLCNNTDSLSDWSLQGNQTFTVDSAPPQVTIIMPANQTYATRTINFNISANESVSSCKYTLNSWAANTTMSSFNSTYCYNTTTVSSDGTYTARFWCNDTAGNINSTQNIVFTVDTTPPAITIRSPAETTYGNSTITINLTNSSDANTVWWNNGTDNQTYTSVVTQVFSDGAYMIIAYANDSSNNLNQTSVIFTVDTTSPVLAVLSPANQTYSTSSISFNILSDEPLSSCKYTLNNWATNNSMAALSQTNYYSSATVSDGSYTPMFWCNDTTGNARTDETGAYAFTVDTAPPNITINSPTSTTYTNSTITINITSSSDASAVWWFNGTINQTYTDVTTQVFSSGTKTIVAYANDSAGNINFTSVSFTVSFSSGETNSASGGGGGGGGASEVSASKPDFKLSIERIDISAAIGSTTTKQFTIENNGTVNGTVKLSVSENIKKFATPSELEFGLLAGEIKTVEITVFIPEDTTPGSHEGSLKIQMNGKEYEIPVKIEITISGAKGILDAKLRLIDKEAPPGGKINYNLTLYYFGEEKPLVANINTRLKSNETTYHETNETAAIMDELGLLRYVDIPEDAAPGRYIIEAEVFYRENRVVTSAEINVAPKESFDWAYYIIALAAIIPGGVLVNTGRKKWTDYA